MLYAVSGRGFLPHPGLPAASVTGMAQDDEGFLWLGTEAGLVRYDGVRFKVFRHTDVPPSGLGNSAVSALANSKHGGLWLTTGRGLSLFDPVTFNGVRYGDGETATGPAYGDGNQQLHGVVSDRNDWLWSSSGTNLVRYERHAGTWQDFPAPSEQLGDAILSLFGDAHGLWLGMRGGLWHFDPVSETFTSVAGADGARVHLLVAGKADLLWCGTSAGLRVVDQRTKTFQAVDEEGWSRAPVTALAADDDGRLWFADQHGLFEMDQAARKPVPLIGRSDATRFGSLIPFAREGAGATDPSPHSVVGAVQALFCDRDGSLWVAGSRGLFVVHRRETPLRWLAINRDVQRAPRCQPVFDAAGGMWTATETGFAVVDPTTGAVVHTVDLQDTAPLDVLARRGNEVWAANREGLLRLDRQAQIAAPVPFPSDPVQAGSTRVRDLLCDVRGTMWLASDHGLFRFHPKTDQALMPVTLPEAGSRGPGWQDVTTLAAGLAGELWLGTQRGLVFWDPESGTRRFFAYEPGRRGSLSAGKVTAVLEDEHGVVWVGTEGGGLHQMVDRATDAFTTVGPDEGLPAAALWDLAQDRTGRLWVVGPAGLFYTKPGQKQFQHFDALDPWLGNRVFFSQTHTDRLCVVSAAGLFYTDQVGEPMPAAPPVVSDVVRMRPGSDVPAASVWSEARREGTVSEAADAVTLAFELADMDYGRGRPTPFWYRLDGFDEGWRYAVPAQKRLIYAYLPAGYYQLFFRYGDGAGRETAALSFSVEGDFWSSLPTWPWVLGVVVLVVALGALLTRRRVKPEPVPPGEAPLGGYQKQVLATVSHELRTPLNGIIGLSQALLENTPPPESPAGREHLALVVQSGRRLAGLLDAMLDFDRVGRGDLEAALAPLQLRPLVADVLLLARGTLGDRDLTLVNQVDADLPLVNADAQRLSQVLHNLVGNAVKFTEQGRVTVSAEVKEGMMRVTVRDTGIGIPDGLRHLIFKPFRQGHGSTTRVHGGVGLGLTIAEQLVTLHGGTLTLLPQTGKGAAFCFTLPLADER
ncbi:sensor histidine kinase [Acanthopleuribacter pedis]|nr:sensor histidine kinase [Acanthopleuribacter pedis]